MMLGTQVLFKTHFYISSSAVEQSHTQPVHICLKASLFAMSMSLSGFASPKRPAICALDWASFKLLSGANWI